MLKIRLRRMGSRHRPFYRVVVSDSRRTPTASALEEVGYYDPRKKPAALSLDLDRVDHWVSNGAQPSSTVRRLVAKARSMPTEPVPEVKAEEPVEAAEPEAQTEEAAEAAEPEAQTEEKAEDAKGEEKAEEAEDTKGETDGDAEEAEDAKGEEKAEEAEAEGAKGEEKAEEAEDAKGETNGDAEEAADDDSEAASK